MRWFWKYRWFCPYTGEYGSVKTRIFTYFMQWAWKRIQKYSWPSLFYNTGRGWGSKNNFNKLYTKPTPLSSCWGFLDNNTSTILYFYLCMKKRFYLQQNKTWQVIQCTVHVYVIYSLPQSTCSSSLSDVFLWKGDLQSTCKKCIGESTHVTLLHAVAISFVRAYLRDCFCSCKVQEGTPLKIKFSN